MLRLLHEKIFVFAVVVVMQAKVKNRFPYGYKANIAKNVTLLPKQLRQ